MGALTLRWRETLRPTLTLARWSSPQLIAVELVHPGSGKPCVQSRCIGAAQ